MAEEQQMTPEQQEELKKKLENMSPEELKEFQKKQCIFCHIVSGKVAAKKIYEDDKTIAVLDINPANPGHVLLIPKEHYMIMPQMPEDELAHIFVVAKHLSNVLLKTLDVRGTNIIVANGPAAGQKAQHFMIHIIPRKDGDGLEFTLPSNKRLDEELEQVTQTVKKKLNELLGVHEEEQKISAEDLLKKKSPDIVEAEYKEDKKSEEDEKEEEESEDYQEESDEDDREREGKDNEDEERTKEDEGSDKGSEEESEEGDKSDDEDQEKKGGEIDLDSIARVLNG